MASRIRYNKFVADGDQYTTKERYVHKNEDRTYSAYYDGWSHGKTEKTYRKAAEWLFLHHGAGGYELLYYPTIAGEINIQLCGTCALEDFLNDPSVGWHVENSDGDGKYETDLTCDQCSEIIAEQLCPECGDPIREKNTGTFNDAPLPQFVTSCGNTYHGKCLAKLVVKGESKKVGKQSYTVHWGFDQIARGGDAQHDFDQAYIAQMEANR